MNNVSKQCHSPITAFILAIAMLIVTLALFPDTSQADQGIKVTDGIIRKEVSAGEIFTHTMVVSANASGAELDIRIEARGLGQGPDGSYIPLVADEDLSPYSAREFITNIDHPSFTLAPGESREVTVTVTVPDVLGEGTRYAIVYIHTEEVGTAAESAVILAANVLTVLTSRDTDSVQTGIIEDVTVGQIETGQPLHIYTMLKNTGDHHYKAYNEITITDASGKEIAYSFTPPTASSIIPAFSFRFDPRIVPRDELPTGTYRVESKMFHEDSSILDTANTSFEITKPWEMFPPQIVKESLQTFSIADEEPPEIDALDQSNVRIAFRDTGIVEGFVITGRYDDEPQVAVPFADPEDKGGTGKDGIKFSGIHLDGFAQGTARVTFSYNGDEISGFEENSLFLAYWNGRSWLIAENIEVFTGARTVRADIPVQVMAGMPLGIGGEKIESDPPLYLYFVGIVLAAVIILTLGFMGMRRKFKRT
jgi:hypothetical protein